MNRAPSDKVRRFFLPPLTIHFFIRIFFIAVTAYLFFSYVCLPLQIKGNSMEPTYGRRGINFCWRLRYLFSKPERHDVVVVRFAGSRVMLLKRVVGLEGERVEFRNGKFFVNGSPMEEPYVRYPCDWNLPPRKVDDNSVYVIGDNRSMAIENHYFGQVSMERIMGGPIW